MNSLKQKFFLISFLPALAYWYLEDHYPIKVAIIGGLILAIIEIGAEYLFCKKVHTLSKFNFILILMMGGLSLLGDDGIWFKLSPYFSGIFISGFLYLQLRKGKSLLWETLQEMPSSSQNMPLPQNILKFILFKIEKHFALFIISYAHWMGAIAIWGSSDQWIFFKTIGQYIAFSIFMVGELLLMRRKMKQIITHQQISSTLQNLSREMSLERQPNKTLK